MFKCGFYEREITPPLGCHLSGYGNIRPATDVKDRLMARACVISDGSETVALIAIVAYPSESKGCNCRKSKQIYGNSGEKCACCGNPFPHGNSRPGF